MKIIALLILITLFPSPLLARFTFGVLGDSRGGHNIHKTLLKIAKQWNAQLVINTGDIITHPGHPQEWSDFWKIVGKQPFPYLLTVGNHDVDSKQTEEMWKKQVNLPGNELYYSYEKDDTLFVILDSMIPGEEKRITGKQWRWLKKTLNPKKYKYQFVFLHHPLFTEPNFKHHKSSLDQYPNHRDKLHKLMVQKKVTAVFVGHEHTYHRMKKNGINYIITGGGGAILYSGFCHIVIVNIDDGHANARVIDWKGITRFDYPLK